MLMLKMADETGIFIQKDLRNTVDYRKILEQLKANREEQRSICSEIKAETQFNAQLKLTSKLKELQMQEEELKEKMK